MIPAPYHSTTVKTSPSKPRESLRFGALLCILFLAAVSGCARSPVEKAIAGEYDKEKNNKIIIAYCTSCHSHKEFEAPPHLEKVSTLYEEEPYRGATECSVCHDVALKGWAIPWVKRHTHRPHGRMIPLARQIKPPAPPDVK